MVYIASSVIAPSLVPGSAAALQGRAMCLHVFETSRPFNQLIIDGGAEDWSSRVSSSVICNLRRSCSWCFFSFRASVAFGFFLVWFFFFPYDTPSPFHLIPPNLTPCTHTHTHTHIYWTRAGGSPSHNISWRGLSKNRNVPPPKRTQPSELIHFHPTKKKKKSHRVQITSARSRLTNVETPPPPFFIFFFVETCVCQGRMISAVFSVDVREVQVLCECDERGRGSFDVVCSTRRGEHTSRGHSLPMQAGGKGDGLLVVHPLLTTCGVRSSNP